MGWGRGERRKRSEKERKSELLDHVPQEESSKSEQEAIGRHDSTDRPHTATTIGVARLHHFHLRSRRDPP